MRWDCNGGGGIVGDLTFARSDHGRMDTDHGSEVRDALRDAARAFGGILWPGGHTMPACYVERPGITPWTPSPATFDPRVLGANPSRLAISLGQMVMGYLDRKIIG